MTPSSPLAGPLGEILTHAHYVLLDFDGPVCDIFSGLPATTVADRLRKLISGQGISMPAAIASSPDPIEIFTYSATVSPELAAQVEAEMADQEQAAVATARPTPYVHDVVTSCRESGRPIAVVSNNSDRAVRSYLARHGLDDRIDLISARTSSDPALLKPDPHLIQKAIAGLHADSAACVLIGDSTTDIQAAALAGIDSIGYANKVGKYSALVQAGATAVVSSLADLVLGLRARKLGA